MIQIAEVFGIKYYHCFDNTIEELPEEEKNYNRNTSINTLMLNMKLGFKISQ